MIWLSILLYQQFSQIAKGFTYNELLKIAQQRMIKGEVENESNEIEDPLLNYHDYKKKRQDTIGLVSLKKNKTDREIEEGWTDKNEYEEEEGSEEGKIGSIFFNKSSKVSSSSILKSYERTNRRTGFIYRFFYCLNYHDHLNKINYIKKNISQNRAIHGLKNITKFLFTINMYDDLYKI